MAQPAGAGIGVDRQLSLASIGGGEVAVTGVTPRWFGR